MNENYWELRIYEDHRPHPNFIMPYKGKELPDIGLAYCPYIPQKLMKQIIPKIDRPMDKQEYRLYNFFIKPYINWKDRTSSWDRFNIGQYYNLPTQYHNIIMEHLIIDDQSFIKVIDHQNDIKMRHITMIGICCDINDDRFILQEEYNQLSPHVIEALSIIDILI